MTNLNIERAYVLFNFIIEYFPNFDGEIPTDFFGKIFQEYSGLSLMSFTLFQKEMIYLNILTKISKNFLLNQKNLTEKTKILDDTQKKFLNKRILQLSKKIKF